MSAPYGKPLSDLAMAERDSQVVELKRQDLSFQQIADHLGVSKATAVRAFQRALKRIPAEQVHLYRDEQLAELAVARHAVMEVLTAHHVVVQNGRIVTPITGRDEEGNLQFGDPLEDHGPVLAAVDRLLKINQREAEILGSDAAGKLTADVSVNYTVAGVDTGALS